MNCCLVALVCMFRCLVCLFESSLGLECARLCVVLLGMND